MKTDVTKNWGSWTALNVAMAICVLAAMSVLGQSARADGSGNADVQDNGCMQDVAGFNLNCTANDVNLGTVTNIVISDPCDVTPGDTVTFSGDFEMNLTAQGRHDVGLWFSNDGDPNADGALTGLCTAVTPAYAPDPTWLDLDGVNDDPNGVIQDTCGDIDAAHNPLIQNFELTVACVDDDGDGMLDLPYCSSWRQPGANDLCVSPLDAFPGAPSKCNCEPGFSVDVPVPFTGTIEVIKDLEPNDDDGLFNLQVDGTTVPAATDVSDGGTTGPVLVSAGISTDTPPIGEDHTAGEMAGTGTSLDDYNSEINCTDGVDTEGPTAGAGPQTVYVEPDDAWVCTITNTRKAKLALVKEVINDNGGTAATTEWTLSAAGPTPLSGAGGVLSTEVGFGDYTLSESPGPGGYTAGDWSCVGGTQNGNVVTIGAGDDVTCTIINDDISPTLTVIKTVINDNGGTAEPDDFNLTVDGGAVLSGATNDFDAGAHQVAETLLAGYSAGSWGGDCAADGSITLALDEDATCTITNNDISPTLTLIKTVINDNGGTAAPDDFNLTVDGGAVLSGATNDFDAGAHTAAETPLTGYSAGSWGGDCAADGSITLALDEDATCTITNNDISPTLTLIKTVVNDNGGTADPDDFNLTVDGGAVLSGATNNFDAGGHTAAETLLAGYSAGSWGGDCAADGSITLALDEDATCTITNNDISPTLTLIKTVVNDNGGTAAPDDFNLTVDGGAVLSGATNNFNAGGHTAAETLLAGYSAGSWGGDCAADGSITLALDEDATCTITNNDISPTLTLIKTVVNDNGGTADPDDFNLTVDGGAVLSGATNNFDAGGHTAAETLLAGYSAGSWGGDCAADGSITLALDEDATCTITNNDISPTLTLIKTVVNDNGGTAAPDDFNLTVDGGAVLSGATNNFDAGAHTAAETPLAGYAAGTWGGDCAADGSITLALDEDATCTITNNDISPTLTLIKTVINDNGGTAAPDDFNLTVDGGAVLSGATNDFDAGAHTAAETPLAGYAAGTWGGDCAADGSITLALDEDATCTITNNDIAPTLTLVKTIINDDGGTVTDPNAFGLRIDGGLVSDSAANTVTAGAHTASEDGLAGYAAGTWSGDCAADGSITLALDEDATCYITNDDIAPTLTLVKTIINDDGGTVTDPNAFGLRIDGGLVSDSAANTVTAGAHTASEDGLLGYAASSWSGDCAADGSITLALDEDATCYITNDDISPTLTLIKTVTNDDGGTAAPDDFNLTVDGGAVLSGATNAFAAGAHTAAETLLAGYSAGSWGGDCAADGSITLALAQNATCTITNDDIAPTLKLVKTVDNGSNPGGTAVADDWTLSATAANPNDGRNFSTAGGSGAFTTVFANAGYGLSESAVAGYQLKTNWSCNGGTLVGSTITLGLDEDVTCTIVNEAQGMTTLLKLTQGVENQTMQWNFTLNGPGVNESDSSPPTTVDFGDVKLIPGEEYTMCETGIPGGWTTIWQVDTDGDGVPDTMIPHVPNVNNDPVDPITGFSRVYDPNYVPFPGTYTNDTRCVNFVVDVGETLAFEINNTFPGGDPRTIGFWKNWNTCTNGNQDQTAAGNGGPDAGWYILNDLLNDPGYDFGDLSKGSPNTKNGHVILDSDDCELATLLLDKRDFDGKKRASDAAYGMAAQLLAAELNLSAGAETCQAVIDAVAAAEQLLFDIEFDAFGAALKGKGSQAIAAEANDLAYTLDQYNNGNLCSP